MFKRKIIARLLALSVLLSCLGFIVTTKTENVSADLVTYCHSCGPNASGQPVYCTWQVDNNCATDPPLKGVHCISVPTCDPE